MEVEIAKLCDASFRKNKGYLGVFIPLGTLQRFCNKSQIFEGKAGDSNIKLVICWTICCFDYPPSTRHSHCEAHSFLLIIIIWLIIIMWLELILAGGEISPAPREISHPQWQEDINHRTSELLAVAKPETSEPVQQSPDKHREVMRALCDLMEKRYSLLCFVHLSLTYHHWV